MMLRQLAALLLGGALLAGCQSLTVPMNQPLPMTAQGTPDFAANYGLAAMLMGQGAEASPVAQNDLLVFVTFSGGGKRSSAFGHGALRGLRAIPAGQTGRSLLDEVDYLAGVSGGSFPAAHYGLYRERHFETFRQDFLTQDINAYIFGTYLLPWNWDWLVNPLVGTNDYMARVYDHLMFRGATFADLQRRGAPMISVNATDVVNETTFPFTGGTFGLLCSDLNSFPIARAVAASNGFPVLFSPITLQNHAADCRGQRPPGTAPHVWAEPASVTSRRAALARQADRYADAEATRWIHLMDGGIADNLALRGLLDSITVTTENSPLFRQVALRTRRILILSVDGEAAPDRSLSQQRVVTGIGQVLNAVSGTQIDAYNFETLGLAAEMVQHLARAFREVRCAQAPMVNGQACGDVQGEFVHVGLAGIDDPIWRARLESIPTGLTIPDADVDALVQYGEQLVRQHPQVLAIAAAAGTAAPATPRRVSGRAAR
ncbi:MAG: patatin-like phospholipase family protein [Roseococcus sp.]